MDIIMPIKAQMNDPMTGKNITVMLPPVKIAECDPSDIEKIVTVVARSIDGFAKGWHVATVTVTGESITVTAQKE